MNNKYDFTFFVQARNANPNGDPDMGNLPRIDEETMHGFMTDVCIKKNIRNYIENAFAGIEGMDIIIKEATNVNESIAEAALKVNEEPIKIDKKTKKPKNLKVSETTAELCKRYFDVRTFGGVLSTGLNGGQILGPVQFEFGKSLDPVFIKDITITRNCFTDTKNLSTLEEYKALSASMSEDEKRTMGRKQFIPYGLYRINGYVSAAAAKKCGFSEKDLKLLFEAILNMYNYSPSSSKSGMSVISPIIIFKHVGRPDNPDTEERTREAVLGCAPAYKLHELIDIKKKEEVEYPRDYTDYDISINLTDLPRGVEVGFKYMPFEDIVWDKPNDKWLKTI